MIKAEFIFALILICFGCSLLGSFRLESIFGPIFIALGAYATVDAFYFRKRP